MLYVISYPWFLFFAYFIGAEIIGSIIVSVISGPTPDMSRIFYGYGTGLFMGGIIGGIILGGWVGLLYTGIIREILEKKQWQRGEHNIWGIFAGLSIGIFYSIIFVQVNIINTGNMPLGRYLLQDQAMRRIRIFCLPKNLPENVNPNPIFYETGDPSVPDVGVLYQNVSSSERAFIIIMDDVSQASRVQFYGDYDYFNPIKYCENKVVLSNGLQACYRDLSTRPTNTKLRADIVEGPPLMTILSWQIRQDKNVTIYSIMSPSSLEETKAIAASICSK